MFDSRTSWSFAKHEPAESIHGIREKPHGSLDMVQRPLNRCREKRLLNTLNRHTSEQVSSNEKQGCQDWGFDFHEIHAIFFLLSIGSHRKPYAKRIGASRHPTTARIRKFFRLRWSADANCDEQAVPIYRHAPKYCLAEEVARPEVFYQRSQDIPVSTVGANGRKYLWATDSFELLVPSLIARPKRCHSFPLNFFCLLAYLPPTRFP